VVKISKDDYKYLYSDEDIRILEKYLGHKVKNIKVKKIKSKKGKYLYTDEQLKTLEKCLGHKVENLRISDYSDANKEDIDMYLGDGILEKEDLEPEELDDLLIPEEEWDDYE